jgi:hypothetical protein
VTVAVDVDWPSATMVCGERARSRVVAVPDACAAVGIKQQAASAMRTLSRIVVRLVIVSGEQRRPTAAKRSLVLTRYPAFPKKLACGRARPVKVNFIPLEVGLGGLGSG